MHIKKIKLNVGGVKGADITSILTDERGNRSLPKEHVDKIKHPIQLAFERPMKDLRFHLLDLCGCLPDGIDKNDIDRAIEETEVTEIKLEGEGFQLFGIRSKFDGKFYPLDTVIVEPIDEYEYYETVQKIIEVIVKEAKLYMKGEAVVTDEELVTRLIEAGKAKVDKDTFEHMSDEEKKEFCKNLLEKNFGAVVILEDDVQITHDDLSGNDQTVIPDKEEEGTVLSKTEEIVLPKRA